MSGLVLLVLANLLYCVTSASDGQCTLIFPQFKEGGDRFLPVRDCPDGKSGCEDMDPDPSSYINTAGEQWQVTPQGGCKNTLRSFITASSDKASWVNANWGFQIFWSSSNTKDSMQLQSENWNKVAGYGISVGMIGSDPGCFTEATCPQPEIFGGHPGVGEQDGAATFYAGLDWVQATTPPGQDIYSASIWTRRNRVGTAMPQEAAFEELGRTNQGFFKMGLIYQALNDKDEVYISTMADTATIRGSWSTVPETPSLLRQLRETDTPFISGLGCDRSGAFLNIASLTLFYNCSSCLKFTCGAAAGEINFGNVKCIENTGSPKRGTSASEQVTCRCLGGKSFSPDAPVYERTYTVGTDLRYDECVDFNDPENYCTQYSPPSTLVNQSCVFEPPETRHIYCNPGYAFTVDDPLNNRVMEITDTSYGQPPCDQPYDMCLHSPPESLQNAICEYHGEPSTRIIKCDEGWSWTIGMTGVLPQTVIDFNPILPCNTEADMCALYSPPPLMNGRCDNDGLNRRVITCDIGYSKDDTPEGRFQYLEGDVPHESCSVALDMCEAYPPDITEGKCVYRSFMPASVDDGGPGYRGYECNEGYSSDGTIDGISSPPYTFGVDPYEIICVALDMCLYEEPRGMNVADCVWAVVTPNVRTITCKQGYSTDSTPDGHEIQITGVGEGAPTECNTALDMCEAYPPMITKGRCVYDPMGTPPESGPGHRGVHCDDGYSLDGGKDTIDLWPHFYGIGEMQYTCVPLDMCEYEQPLGMNVASCAWDMTPNVRTITCRPGYSTDSTPGGALLEITGVGEGTPTECNTALDMCEAYPPMITKGRCVYDPMGTPPDSGPGYRGVHCDDGYSLDGSKYTIDLSSQVYGIGEMEYTCVPLDMCEYEEPLGINVQRCDWNPEIPNVRTITCNVGYSTSDDASGASLDIAGVGRGVTTCNIALDMCEAYPPIIFHGTCFYDPAGFPPDSGPGHRGVHCDDGYSLDGSKYTIDLWPHSYGTGDMEVTCIPLNMCEYEQPLGNHVASCDFDEGVPNRRIITCEPGWSTNGLAAGATLTIDGVGSGVTSCDTSLDMCEVYSPNATLAAFYQFCIPNGPANRIIYCFDGYTWDEFAGTTPQYITNLDPIQQPCYPIDMCDVYTGTQPHGDCFNNMPNEREITCHVGYSTIDGDISATFVHIVGPGPGIPDLCDYQLNMCLYPNNIINGTCQPDDENAGYRFAHCNDGYSTLLNDPMGIDSSPFYGTGTFNMNCGVMDMCIAYWDGGIGSHADCTFNPSAANTRNYYCQSGWSRDPTLAGRGPFAVPGVGQGPEYLCVVEYDACLHSPNGSLPNMYCMSGGFNTRKLYCMEGWSTLSDVDPQIVIGEFGTFEQCNIGINPCDEWSSWVGNGQCQPVGQARNITCKFGYSINSSKAGRFQFLTGNTPHVDCDVILDICTNYSSTNAIVNGTCVFNSGEPGNRSTQCNPGYSYDDSFDGLLNPGQSFSGEGTYSVNCAVFDMCKFTRTDYWAISPHADCEFNYNVPNVQVLTCQAGYSRDDTLAGRGPFVVVGPGGNPATDACPISYDMCLHSPNGSLPNAFCVSAGHDRRNIYCDDRYTSDGGSLQNIAGLGTILPCYPDDQCNLYSPNVTHGACTSVGLVRNITCNWGYSSNKSVAGRYQVLGGTEPHDPCDVILDMCTNYTDLIVNGSCVFQTASPGCRSVWCWDGYSTDLTPAGIVTGPFCSEYDPIFAPCGVMNMCDAYPVVNGDCAFNPSVPNVRQITCTGGYSSTPAIAGTTFSLFGLNSTLCDTQLNMCLYSLNPISATCFDNGLNSRRIVCDPGLSSNQSVAGVTQIITGPGPFLACNVTLDLCGLYSNPVINGDCTVVGAERNITCHLGYSSTLTAAGRYQIVSGVGPHLPCNVIDMCTNYSATSSVVNGTCVFFPALPGYRTINCSDGYSTDNSVPGISKQVYGEAQLQNCGVLDMCLAYSSNVTNGTCAFNFAVPNHRVISCIDGMSSNGTISGTVNDLVGAVPTVPCNQVLDMCLYSPNGSIGNGSCVSNGFNSRRIICDDGLSTNSSASGITQLITGTGGYLPCSTVLNMCIYSLTVTNGNCTPNGLNSRIITCHAGFNSTAGEVQVIFGAGSYQSCVKIDSCFQYSPIVQNGTCNETAINTRNITCDVGYSSSTTAAGVYQTIVGSAPHVDCLVVMNMCTNYTTPVINGTCASNSPGWRTFTCDDGYSRNSTVQGITSTFFGAGTQIVNCSVLNMCTAYSPTVTNGNCTFNSANPNTRTIYCLNGYSSDDGDTGVINVVFGTDIVTCSKKLDMCAVYSNTVINGSCANSTNNTRRITCNAGYSSNGTDAGIVQIVIGPGPYSPCNVMNMCAVYSPSIPNGVCTNNGVNSRNITCNTGFNSSSGQIQIINGTDGYDPCIRYDTCTQFSPTVRNGTCNESAPGTRNITCDVGYSSSTTAAGVYQTIVGVAPHVDCLVIMNMCTNYTTTMTNGSCSFSPAAIGRRTFNCNQGYSIDGTVQGITSTFFGAGTRIVNCSVLDMCAAYSPTVTNGNCTFNSANPNTRTIYCLNGYSSTSTAAGTINILVGTNATTCGIALDMCVAYSTNASVINGSCFPNGVNSRRIVCDDGMSSNSSAAGVTQIITGPGSYNPCSTVLNMCAVYSPTINNGICTSNGLNSRNITCNSGFNTTSGRVIQIINGTGTYLPCVEMDICFQYSPIISNGSCSVLGTNIRNITCFPGYSSNSSLNGITQILVGPVGFNDCTFILNMCTAYSTSIVNGTCSFSSLTPGYRRIVCNAGHSINGSAAGVNSTFYGAGAISRTCSVLDMCTAYSPSLVNGVCEFLFSVPNKRTITCDPGWSSTNDTTGIVNVLTGDEIATCDYELDMCQYSLNPTNAVCFSNGVNSRRIVCDEGWSSNTLATGVTRIINGSGTFAPCTVQLDMCVAYSPIIEFGSCVASFFNTRVISCDPGYATSTRAIGQSQEIIGSGPYLPCLLIDMCAVYSPIITNGVCTNQAPNTRNITCDSGWSSTAQLTGRYQKLIGMVDYNECNVIIQMCGNYTSPVTHGKCEFDFKKPNTRTVVCTPGYSTNNFATGTRVDVIGTGPLPGCPIVLNMCNAYSPNPENAVCIFKTLNTRNITCNPGWSTTALPSGVIQVFTGDGPFLPCTTQLDMCALYSHNSTLRNATCYTSLNTRTIICDGGYSINFTAAGTTQVVSGTGPINPNCLDILLMCKEYSPIIPHGVCVDVGLNTRRITCDSGYGIKANKSSEAYQIVIGSGPYSPCRELLPCFLYSDEDQLVNGNCTDLPGGIRKIGCGDGWSSDETIAGTSQTLSGSTPHKNCTTELDMCLYSPNATFADGTCYGNGFNSRILVCDNGHAFTNNTDPDIRRNFTGPGLGPTCKPVDMCAVYDPNLNETTFCTWTGINTRTRTCNIGWSLVNYTEIRDNPLVGPALDNTTYCIDLDECTSGYWAIYTSNNTKKKCSQERVCINFYGTFECCEDGFQSDATKTKCLDINECVTGEYASKPSTNGAPCSNVDNCINFLNGTFGCCEPGFATKDWVTCDDIDECQQALSTCQRADLCVNTWGNYTCCALNETVVNNTCHPCVDEFVPVPTNAADPFPSLRRRFANYSNLSFAFKSCSSCEGSFRLLSRNKYHPACTEATTAGEACQYPCTNQSFVTTAEDAIDVLRRVFGQDNFLKDLAWILWKINITIPESTKKRATTFPVYYPCENASMVPMMLPVFQELALEITPRAPNLNLQPTPGSCGVVGVSSSDPTDFNPTGVIVGVIVGSALAIIIIGLIIYKYMHRSQLHYLPKGVNWSYKLYEKMPYTWTERGTSDSHYYFKVFEKGGDHYKRALDLFHHTSGANTPFGGYTLAVTKVTAVYNKILVSNFINSYKIMLHRFKTNKDMFFGKAWLEEAGAELRKWRYDKYQQLVEKYDWNKENDWGKDVPILPACHGTDVAVAEKICETGFAALSSLDAGWYGKGIYFTTHAWYTFPYIVVKRMPAILLCWVLPGNSLPVCEHHLEANSLLGKPLNGYMSHFVVTLKNGEVPERQSQEMFDEIVIPQESQVTPAFVFELELKNLKKILPEWNRDMPETRTRKKETLKNEKIVVQ